MEIIEKYPDKDWDWYYITMKLVTMILLKIS